jgi:hypothetical protein
MFNYDIHWIEWACGSISTALFAVWIWRWQEGRKPKKIINTDPPLKVPDVIVTISKYLDNSIKIHATNAYGVAVVETGKNHVIDTVFKDAGYQHIQQYRIEPPQATLEASTTLEPVEVAVEEAPKKELPYEPNEYVAKMQGKALDRLNEPFEPHPEIND